MNIPDKLKIGGIVYKIELVDEIRDGDNAGRLETKKNRILLDKTGPINQLELTLLHEIIHAINIEVEEKDVEFLAQALYQVLVDNGLVFDGKAPK